LNKQPSLDGYDLIREIGHGSQGDVWLAQRRSDKQKVAVKRLNIESVKNWKEYELFKREASVLATLNIDGVAKFYEAIDRLDDNPPCSYIVQEYIDGRTLAEMIQSGQRFSVNWIYDIILQLIDILQKLHTHEPPVIHRDLKPSNILIKQGAAKDKVYLIDFGAVANPQVQSGGSTVAGTYGYMPPEQLMGKPMPQSDIYALAAVAVHLITGISPAEMPNKDFHLIFEPQMQNMPVAVVNTLRSMLEPKVEMRLCDYDTLRMLFKNFNNNIYTDTGSRQALMPITEYNRRLRQVSTYCEPGNIELWQELPDQLPRYANDQQHAYFKLEKAQNSFQTNGFPVFEMPQWQTGEHLPPYGYLSQLLYILVSAIFYALIIIAGSPLLGCSFYVMDLINPLLINPLKDSMISLEAFTLLELSIPLLFTIPYILFVIKFMPKGKIALLFHKYYNNLSLPKEDRTLVQNYVNELIQNGKKTIATIVSIEYQLMESTYLESNPNEEQNQVGYYYHRSPQFKLTYKFNPPDDEKAEDLVHHIYTHLPPEDHFKAGDPLPILYRIYKNEDNFEIVDSMPYPLPLDDIGELNNAVYHISRENR
jgi:serine/threonine protein kinase